MKRLILKDWEVTNLQNNASRIWRPMRPQPELEDLESSIAGREPYKDGVVVWIPWTHIDGYENEDIINHSPFGQVGDEMWIAESWCPALTDIHYSGNPTDHGGKDDPCCGYRADGVYTCGKLVPDGLNRTWLSGAQMPRMYSRYTIRITNIAIQQIQSLTIQDILPILSSKAADENLMTWMEWAKLRWDIDNKGAEFIAYRKNPWVWLVDYEFVNSRQKSFQTNT